MFTKHNLLSVVRAIADWVVRFTEARKLQEVGEIEYMRQAGYEALEWIRTNPGDFIWLTLQRFANL